MDVEKRNELIAKIAEKKRLEVEIQSTVDTIKQLKGEVESAVYNYVQDAEDVDTAVAICNEFGIPVNRRWMERAYKNSNEDCPNHDETEWYDVISSIDFEIEQLLEKHAKEGFRYTQ